jgi:UDP-2,3-diacylglucosamine pyrophosphatase LpxH
MGNFRMDDKLVLELDGKKAWFFHGDVFDNSISGAKWLAKLGGVGYDILVLLNLFINKLLKKLGRPKVSLSKKVKDSVKRAVKHVHDFEQLAAELALQKGYDYVVMGHIHKAQIRTIETKEASIEYLNSGDWIENLTALEYKEKTWSIFQYQEKDFAHTVEDMPSEADELEHSAGALLASFMEGIEVK